MKVYMTRNEDIFIPLQVRVAKAQKQRADLFVSIHADAFTSRQPSGSSVFALSTKGATSTAAKYLAQTQNASDLIGGVSKSGDRYVDHTMFDMVQSLTIADSLKFGKAVLNKLGKINKLHKNQVEQAGFAVLKAPDIPSILVETAFISNVEEERKLKTATFQQEVAESILAGIKAYFADGRRWREGDDKKALNGAFLWETRNKKTPVRVFNNWLRGAGFETRRPSGYEPDELPGCSTPRHRTALFHQI